MTETLKKNTPSYVHFFEICAAQLPKMKYVSNFRFIKCLSNNFCMSHQFYSQFTIIDQFTGFSIQLWTFAYIRLLNRPYENEVTSKEHN